MALTNGWLTTTHSYQRDTHVEQLFTNLLWCVIFAEFFMVPDLFLTPTICTSQVAPQAVSSGTTAIKAGFTEPVVFLRTILTHAILHSFSQRYWINHFPLKNSEFFKNYESNFPFLLSVSTPLRMLK